MTTIKLADVEALAALLAENVTSILQVPALAPVTETLMERFEVPFMSLAS